jgi:transcriptional regulator with XRE-family HTH domain
MFKTEKKKIGEQLKSRREALKVSQEYVQDYTSISPSTLSNLEQGKSNYTIDKFLSVLDILGLEIEIKVREV